MALSRIHLLSASQLDRKLPALRQAAAALARAAPTIGWIKALRQSLGLTTVAFARRLQVAQQTVVDLESSERAGTITLASLRRAADALDAQFVYALVPRKSPRSRSMSGRASSNCDREIYGVNWSTRPRRDAPHGRGSSGIEDPIRQNSQGTQRGRGCQHHSRPGVGVTRARRALARHALGCLCAATACGNVW